MAPRLVSAVQFSTGLRRLTFHKRFPWLAAQDVHHSAIYLWAWNQEHLSVLASLGDAIQERLFFQSAPEVAWHPFLPRIAVSDDGGISQWDVEQGGPCRLVARQGSGEHGTVCFSPHGHLLAGRLESEEPADWFSSEHENGSMEWPMSAMANHPEGHLIAFLEPVTGYDESTCLRFLSFSEDPRSICLWDRGLFLEGIWIGLEFNPQGDRLCCRGTIGREHVLLVLDFPSLFPRLALPIRWLRMSKGESLSALEKKLIMPSKGDGEACFSPDGHSLLLATPLGELLDIDIEKRSVLRFKLRDHPLISVGLRAREGIIAVSDREGWLGIYQMRGQEHLPDSVQRPLTSDFLSAAQLAKKSYPEYGYDPPGSGQCEPLVLDEELANQLCKGVA